MSDFAPAKEKFYLKSLDDGTLVTAQFNPKELQVDRASSWSPANDTNKSSNVQVEAAKKSGAIVMEYQGNKGRSISVELLFDGYEGEKPPYGVDVIKEVGKLEHLATVRNPAEKKEDLRRAHWCVATWGTALQSFRCVVDTVTTKYTMFDPSGKPLRATCTVKLLEADMVSGKEKDKAGGK